MKPMTTTTPYERGQRSRSCHFPLFCRFKTMRHPAGLKIALVARSMSGRWSLARLAHAARPRWRCLPCHDSPFVGPRGCGGHGYTAPSRAHSALVTTTLSRVYPYCTYTRWFVPLFSRRYRLPRIDNDKGLTINNVQVVAMARFEGHEFGGDCT